MILWILLAISLPLMAMRDINHGVLPSRSFWVALASLFFVGSAVLMIIQHFSPSL